MKKRSPVLHYAVPLITLLFITSVQAGQQLAPVSSRQAIIGGETLSFPIIYTVSEPETATETGIGLRVHYNSTLINPAETQLFATAVQPSGAITPDTEDFDNDPQTDHYFVAAWVDFDAEWPGAKRLPLPLMQLGFTATDNFAAATHIRFSASATARETTFQSTPLLLCPKPVVSVALSSQVLREDASSQTLPRFIFSTETAMPLVCGDLTINYTLAGSATAGEDFSTLPPSATLPAGQKTVDLPVTVINDDLVEADESLILTLQNGTDYQRSDQSAVTATIKSEDTATLLPKINLSVSKTTLVEGQGGSLLLYVSRSGENIDLSQALAVQIEVGGTVTLDADYQSFSGTIVIPAGKTTAFSALVLKDDAEKESDESLTLEIKVDSQYQRGPASYLELTITDDEVNQNTSLAVARPTSQVVQVAQAVPSNHQWMLLLMGLLLSGFAGLQLRRSEVRKV